MSHYSLNSQHGFPHRQILLSTTFATGDPNLNCRLRQGSSAGLFITTYTSFFLLLHGISVLWLRGELFMYMHCPYGLLLSNNSCSEVDGEAKIVSPGSTGGGAQKFSLRLGSEDNTTDSDGEGGQRTFNIVQMKKDESRSRRKV